MQPSLPVVGKPYLHMHLPLPVVGERYLQMHSSLPVVGERHLHVHLPLLHVGKPHLHLQPSLRHEEVGMLHTQHSLSRVGNRRQQLPRSCAKHPILAFAPVQRGGNYWGRGTYAARRSGESRPSRGSAVRERSRAYSAAICASESQTMSSARHAARLRRCAPLWPLTA